MSRFGITFVHCGRVKGFNGDDPARQQAISKIDVFLFSIISIHHMLLHAYLMYIYTVYICM